MSEYLLMGDIHLSDRPPSSCTDSYLDDLFAILDATVQLAADRGIEAVIWAGDVFHHKTPGRTSHATVRALIDLARRYPCPVYVVPGNHDMSNDRFDSLDEGQPLGVVLASGAVNLLRGWSTIGYPIYGVPWLMRFDDDLVAQALDDWRASLRLGAPALVVTHAPLYPPGRELKYENYPAAKWAEAMGGLGSVYYGHVHEPHGVYTVEGVTFCNAGAISRGSLHEHNLTRAVSVAVWDSTTGEFEIVEIPHKPAEQVFRLAEVGEVKTAQLRLDEFLTSVGQTRLEITSIEAVLAHIRALGLDAELETTIADLLSEAS